MTVLFSDDVRRSTNFGISGRTRQIRIHLLAGAIMLSLPLLGLAPERASAGSEELQSLATKKAATIENLHRKAKRALVTAAQDRSFESYFHAHGTGSQHHAKQRIEEVTLATQRRFHVEEMCLIDPTGTEITRIVGDKIAPDSDLSTEEAKAPFFKPGFAEQPRKVYISDPYMSPDAEKWVLAYVTPVMADGEKKAILHYEHGLEIYQKAASAGLSGDDRFILVVSRDGFVISDSRRDIAIGKRGDLEEPGEYFAHLGDVTPKGLMTVYEQIGETRSGSTTISDRGVTFGVAHAVVDGGLVVLAVGRI